jgi:hypothetical protein
MRRRFFLLAVAAAFLCCAAPQQIPAQPQKLVWSQALFCDYGLIPTEPIIFKIIL